MTQKPIKAERAEIKIGEFELEVYQMPDGKYRFSKTLAAEAIEESPKRVSEFLNGKKVQSLMPQGLDVSEIPAKEINSTVTAKTWSLEYVAFYWQMKSKTNAKAEALSVACIAESLERRADAAFNIKRTEEQRNIRFQTRMEGILSRNFWTDTVDAYLNKVDYPRGERWKVYATISDLVNLRLFGLTANHIKSYMMLPPNARTRDFLPTETLKLVDTIERAAAVRLENNDTVPTQALKDVINLLGLQPDIKKLDP